MISLEIARKLKEAGLEWEPQYGDIMTSMYDGFKDNSYVLDEYLVIDKEFIEDYPALKPDELKEFRKWAIFLPRLDQLLAEIYKTYNFTLHSSGYIVLRKKGSGMVEEHFHSDTLENAAASALLWIYEGRK